VVLAHGRWESLIKLKVEERDELLIRIDERMTHIHRALHGHGGDQGLVKKVSEMEGWKNKVHGALVIISTTVLGILGTR